MIIVNVSNTYDENVCNWLSLFMFPKEVVQVIWKKIVVRGLARLEGKPLHYTISFFPRFKLFQEGSNKPHQRLNWPFLFDLSLSYFNSGTNNEPVLSLVCFFNLNGKKRAREREAGGEVRLGREEGRQEGGREEMSNYRHMWMARRERPARRQRRVTSRSRKKSTKLLGGSLTHKDQWGALGEQPHPRTYPHAH